MMKQIDCFHGHDIRGLTMHSKMTLHQRDIRKIRKNVGLFFAGFILLAFAAGFDVFADVPTVKAAGIMTSVEDDGTVVIDKMGYLVDDSAQIIDRKGKSVSLRNLSLPAKVNFEYEYTQKGFVIIFIKQVAAIGDSYETQ
jgi:hypothetical protein